MVYAGPNLKWKVYGSGGGKNETSSWMLTLVPSGEILTFMDI